MFHKALEPAPAAPQRRHTRCQVLAPPCLGPKPLQLCRELLVTQPPVLTPTQPTLLQLRLLSLPLSHVVLQPRKDSPALQRRWLPRPPRRLTCLTAIVSLLRSLPLDYIPCRGSVVVTRVPV